MVNRIDSDGGTRFTSKVLQQIVQALGTKWYLHTPWHPQSSGWVERMNQALKKTLTKLMIETQMSWIRCLPLTLLWVRTQPRPDLGISPYEIMFGLLFLASIHEVATYGEGEVNVVRKYIKTIAQNLEDLRKRGMIPQTALLEFKIHHIKPGDWVLIKSWNEQQLIPQWEDPFQVLVTTQTASELLNEGGPKPAESKDLWKNLGSEL